MKPCITHTHTQGQRESSIRENENLTDATMMRGVVDCFRILSQYQLMMPPMARASVNDGTLYMPWFQD